MARVQFVQAVDLGALPADRFLNLTASARRLGATLTTAIQARYPQVTRVTVRPRRSEHDQLELTCEVHAVDTVPIEGLESIATPIVDDLDAWTDYQKGDGRRRERSESTAGTGSPAGASHESPTAPGDRLEQFERRLGEQGTRIARLEDRLTDLERRLQDVIDALEGIEESELRR